MIRLADIAQILSGISPPKGVERSAAFVQIKDLRDAEGDLLRGPVPSAKRATRIQSHDILVPSRGEDISAFRPSQRMIGAFIGLDIYLVRPDAERVDPDFLMVALNDGRVMRQLKAAATGGALPRIPKHALEDVLVPVPAQKVQCAIARLGALAKEREELQNRRISAEARLNAALLARILGSASQDRIQ